MACSTLSFTIVVSVDYVLAGDWTYVTATNECREWVLEQMGDATRPTFGLLWYID